MIRRRIFSYLLGSSLSKNQEHGTNPVFGPFLNLHRSNTFPLFLLSRDQSISQQILTSIYARMQTRQTRGARSKEGGEKEVRRARESRTSSEARFRRVKSGKKEKKMKKMVTKIKKHRKGQ